MEKRPVELIAEYLGFDDPDPEYKIFTSLRWDPTHPTETLISTQKHPNDLLSYHLDRLIESARGCRFFGAFNLLKGDHDNGLRCLEEAISSFFQSPVSDSNSVCKLRITITKAGAITIDSTRLIENPKSPFLLMPFQQSDSTCSFFDNQESQMSRCTVYLDPHSIFPSVFTTHKTTYRAMYDDSREASGIAEKSPKEAEILTQNLKGEVMEASLSTPYFHRGRWITPPLSSGGNSGVTRRLALEQGCCVEQIILASDLRNGEIIWLSNAVRGFWQGKLELKSKDSAAQTVEGTNDADGCL